MPRYAVDYEADYAPERNRLTTFFRLVLVIPHAIVLLVYAIGFLVAGVIGWFAVLFTGRMPGGLYRYLLGVLRLGTQIGGYAMLATDRYPPFSLGVADFPVRVTAPAEPPAPMNRLKAFFRAILAIPWGIVSNAYGYVSLLAAVGSWFAIVFTGRQPELLQRGLHMGLCAQMHYTAFLFLVAEDWPPFEPELRLAPGSDGPDPLTAGPAAPSISAA